MDDTHSLTIERLEAAYKRLQRIRDRARRDNNEQMEQRARDWMERVADGMMRVVMNGRKSV